MENHEVCECYFEADKYSRNLCPKSTNHSCQLGLSLAVLRTWIGWVMVPIMVSSASPLLRRLCSQQPNYTGLSPAMRRPCKDGTSYIVTGCDSYVRLHWNIHSKPKVPSWMPNEHYFSLGAGAQVWPISHSPFSWYVHLLMACQMVGFLLIWQHAGSSVFAYMALRTPKCMVPGVAWNSLIYAVMTLRTHWDCDLCVLWAINVLHCPADIALYHIGTSQNPFLGEN